MANRFLAPDIPTRLDALGVRLKVENGELLWGARRGTLTDAERAEVKQIIAEHRVDLLAAFAPDPEPLILTPPQRDCRLPADCLAPLICSRLGACERFRAGGPCLVALNPAAEKDQ